MNEIYAIDDFHGLSHSGIKGQKWGIRRYQNLNGSLTPLGKQRLKRYKATETKKLDSKIAANKKAIQKTTNNKYKHFLESDNMRLEAERTAVKRMSYDQMRTEQYATARNTILSLSVVAASVGVKTLLKVPVPNAVLATAASSIVKTGGNKILQTTTTDNIKTRMRLE